MWHQLELPLRLELEHVLSESAPMVENDTIVALGTPSGESAVALVRVSGPLCPALASAIFGALPSPRRATLGLYRDRVGKRLDQVLWTMFAEGTSYTDEAMIEICTHGNPLIISEIIDDLLARGCRMADPGEFTRRAFLAGKMDLAQAEAVADLIAARSERALQAAHKRLDGTLGRRVAAFTDALLDIMAAFEAYIDFPEEDIPPEDDAGPLGALNELIRNLQQLQQTGRYSELLHEGVNAVMVGAPNAGKSSLFNALMGEERALVSEEAGTTRDFITEPMMLGPYAVRLMDTAGLREGQTAIERAGVAKTLERLREADVCLLVVDAAEPEPVFPPGSMALFHVEQTLVVENKVDLPGAAGHREFFAECPRVRVSARTGEGLDELRARWQACIEAHLHLPGPEELLVGVRHADALGRAAAALEAARGKVRAGEGAELAASDLRAGLECLGEIVGRVDNERMLDALFSRFCIGK